MNRLLTDTVLGCVNVGAGQNAYWTPADACLFAYCLFQYLMCVSPIEEHRSACTSHWFGSMNIGHLDFFYRFVYFPGYPRLSCRLMSQCVRGFKSDRDMRLYLIKMFWIMKKTEVTWVLSDYNSRISHRVSDCRSRGRSKELIEAHRHELRPLRN